MVVQRADVFEIDISLSFRITSMSGLISPAWFMASKRPSGGDGAVADHAVTVRRCLFSFSAATANTDTRRDGGGE